MQVVTFSYLTKCHVVLAKNDASLLYLFNINHGFWIWILWKLWCKSASIKVEWSLTNDLEIKPILFWPWIVYTFNLKLLVKFFNPSQGCKTILKKSSNVQWIITSRSRSSNFYMSLCIIIFWTYIWSCMT